ncbi:olfactory receptor 6N1-like [Latimeria chalumnae]|uniref:olfactory receptor 6N1-like n=1 Tax=Latimeria chalumnae TaxID=7897 RepID=UPI00313E15D9
MDSNQTEHSVTNFYIVGFPSLQRLEILVSVFFLTLYALTLIGNSVILYIIATKEKLHSPMYILLWSLAMSNVIFSTVVSPRIIGRYMFSWKRIEVYLCLTQMYLIHFAGSFDSLMLMMMAIDRYLSICHPLRYPTLVTNGTAVKMAVTAVVLGMMGPVPSVSFLDSTTFCGPNQIMHLYCGYSSVIQLACGDITPGIRVVFTVASIILPVPLVFVLFSYTRIIITVISITAPQGRSKAFSTCSAQLIVILIFFIPRLFAYFATFLAFTFSGDIQIALGVFYCLLPPLLNPIIYSLKMKEIKSHVFKLLKGIRITPKKENISTLCR